MAWGCSAGASAPTASGTQSPGSPPPAFYVDGHRKPVFSAHLLPRGLIGRTGKVLGGRALLLLHDALGHPHLATTHRGDLHLTKGVPQFLTRYDQATGGQAVARPLIEREGMGSDFMPPPGAPGARRV